MWNGDTVELSGTLGNQLGLRQQFSCVAHYVGCNRFGTAALGIQTDKVEQQTTGPLLTQLIFGSVLQRVKRVLDEYVFAIATDREDESSTRLGKSAGRQAAVDG